MPTTADERRTRDIECSLDEECEMCTGEACALCGAGTWRSPEHDGVRCEHDVIQRHMEYIE